MDLNGDRRQLKDGFGRFVTYLRLSVTDRCDLRCAYCMAEKMTFLPKREVLSLEELLFLADAFISRGVRKIRVTGGEPLVRKDIMELITLLGQRIEAGLLDELTLTTNGTLLEQHADTLRRVGVRRINISLDTLDRGKFATLSRRDALPQVLRGVEAAREAGLKVKINTVVLKSVNEDEVPDLVEWAHAKGMDSTLIEVMPLGEIGEGRKDQYLPLSAVRDSLAQRWTLNDIEFRTGGPARYVHIEETGGRLGFITPLSNNFCVDCNRVRVTCTGQIYTCLGDDSLLDLRTALRGENPDQDLQALLDRAMISKPERHDFDMDRHDRQPAVVRHMSVTGG